MVSSLLSETISLSFDLLFVPFASIESERRVVDDIVKRKFFVSRDKRD